MPTLLWVLASKWPSWSQAQRPPQGFVYADGPKVRKPTKSQRSANLPNRWPRLWQDTYLPITLPSLACWRSEEQVSERKKTIHGTDMLLYGTKRPRLAGYLDVRVPLNCKNEVSSTQGLENCRSTSDMNYSVSLITPRFFARYLISHAYASLYIPSDWLVLFFP